jgi:CBS domain-containing protein
VVRPVSPETSVRDALSLMLSEGGEPLTVVDADGSVEGLLTLGVIEQLLSDEAAEPVHEPARPQPERTL